MRKRPDMAHRADRSRFRTGAQRAAIGAAVLLVLQFAAGCSRAPTFNILGSFFPSWILCGLLGIVLTVVARLVLVRVGIEQHLSPLVLVYPCLTAFFTFTIWLLFFS
jgi:YtcA family